jgi:hypothetical protein
LGREQDSDQQGEGIRVIQRDRWVRIKLRQSLEDMTGTLGLGHGAGD